MVTTVVLAISIVISLAAGVGIGSASAAAGVRAKAQTECQERAADAGLEVDVALQVCRKSWRRRRIARKAYSREAFERAI